MSPRQSLAVLVCALVFSGCAVAPAHLRLRPEAKNDARRETRAVVRGGAAEHMLAGYLKAWLAAPESAAGRSAGGRFVRLWRKSALPGDCVVDGWRVRVTG